MKWNLKEIAEAVNGKIIPVDNEGIEITGVQFDSRQLKLGDLFVPISAERDGHDFIQSAIDNGAKAAFWSKSETKVPEGFPVIIVENTFKALQDFAKWHLKSVGPKVVAVTGSNGKTTTKDMTEAILAEKYRTHKTEGNYNNQIGLPITILAMPKDTEAAILEMGMDKPGEIHDLSMIAEPDVAVITMIGESHIEFFGSREKIADAKVEILDGLKETGTFIYSGDEPLLAERAGGARKVKTFGKNDQADLYAVEINSGIRSTSFKTNLQPEFEVTIPTPGKYNVQNALAAISAGLELGVSLEEAAKGLAGYQLTKNRLEWLEGYKGSKLLNDAYNASPSSMKAVLDYFNSIEVEGEKIVVLGDILELGELSEELHKSLADFVSEETFDYIVLYGDEMKHLHEELKAKIPESRLTHFSGEKAAMLAYLKEILQSGDAVLLKSSLGTDLLGVVEKLKAE